MTPQEKAALGKRLRYRAKNGQGAERDLALAVLFHDDLIDNHYGRIVWLEKKVAQLEKQIAGQSIRIARLERGR